MEVFMKDVLDEGLIITLVALQPQKEKITTNYTHSSTHMSSTACGNCSGTCQNICTSGCKGTAKKK